MKYSKKFFNLKTTHVFHISVVFVVLIALGGIFFKDTYTLISNTLMNALKSNFSWFYLWTELFFVLFVLVLALSPYGKIKLGKDDDQPEYSTFSWFAMLFAAGMGVGLVFWGIAEPLSHYIAPMAGIEPQTMEAEAFSMRSCFMHWGLHPWSSYAILGLGLAYFQFRKGENSLISNLMKPIFGEKITSGIFGTIVDILTTVITVIGVATSFGMGCIQISAGLHYVLDIPDNRITWICIIILITLCFVTSAIKGLNRGIKLLSNINIILCIILILLVFIVGPKSDILADFFIGIRDYMFNFFQDSVRMHAANGDTSWIRNWRVFYWAWWISWVPFAGTFIARISKGRSIRQFIIGSTIIPTLVSCIWFSIFGGTAINAAGNVPADTLTELLSSPQTILYHVFANYPLGITLSVLAMILCILFYITSADSATFVLAMLTSGGKLNPDNKLKAFWGILIAVVAYALITSGGISSIQTISIIMAFPYVIVMLLICLNIGAALKKEKATIQSRSKHLLLRP